MYRLGIVPRESAPKYGSASRCCATQEMALNKTSHRDIDDGFWFGLVNLIVVLAGRIYFRSRTKIF